MQNRTLDRAHVWEKPLFLFTSFQSVFGAAARRAATTEKMSVVMLAPKGMLIYFLNESRYSTYAGNWQGGRGNFMQK